MVLNEVVRIKFEEWYIPYLRRQRDDYEKFSDDQLLRKFYRTIPVIQYTVFIFFFDAAGLVYPQLERDLIDQYGRERGTKLYIEAMERKFNNLSV